MNRERVKGELQRKAHVMLVYRKMIPSVRLCAHCQLEVLAMHGRFEYQAVQVMAVTTEDMNWADIVILGRLDSWYERQLTMILAGAGRYLMYILDDDLLNIAPYLSSAAYYSQTSIQENIRAMIRVSNAIISPSPLLLKKYAGEKQKCVLIEEPAIDPVSYMPHAPGKPVKIGFAGSIDRTDDVENILKEALTQIKCEYGGRVQFEFFGAIPSFAEDLGARCIPYCDSYDEYRKTLNSLEWDIGLAPMPDTQFHACKHYNKFVEYAGACIVGVYSDNEPYLRAKQLFGCGQFCKNEMGAWVAALSRWIENSEERERYRAAVAELAHGELSVAASAEKLAAELPGLEEVLPRERRVLAMALGVKQMMGGCLRVYTTVRSRCSRLVVKLRRIGTDCASRRCL